MQLPTSYHCNNKKGRQIKMRLFPWIFHNHGIFYQNYQQWRLRKGERDFRLNAQNRPSVAYLDPVTKRYKYPNLTGKYLIRKRFLWLFFTPTSHNSDGLCCRIAWIHFTIMQLIFPIYYEKGKITNANIQTYGGSDRMYYGIGLGYYDESGVLKGTGFNRNRFKC